MIGEIFMTLLAISVVLITLWLGITALLLGGMWVLTPPSRLSREISMVWPWRFLRGAMGIGGTVRGGLLSGGVMGWYCATGFPLSATLRDGGVLFVGGGPC